MRCYVAGGEIVETGRHFYEDDAPPLKAPDADLLDWLWGPAELVEAKMEHTTGHCDAAAWPAYDPIEEEARWLAYVARHPEPIFEEHLP